MKKGFLYTFVMLMVFSVFLVGGVANANPAAPSLNNGPGPISSQFSKDSPPPVDGYVADTTQTVVMLVLIHGSAFVAWIVSFTGDLFDYVIGYTTVFPEPLGAGILASWKIIRDFTNIILVFSLLFLGIRTIIDGNGFADKKVLVGVIIAAILINFSMFFVKDIAFNVSNTVGLQILEQSKINGSKGSVSEGLMSMVSPQKVLSNYGFNGTWGASNVAEQTRTNWTLVFKMMGQFMMFTAIVICMAFVFMGASLILLYRFFIFIFLMIFAPFGLVATQIPWFKKSGSDWWEQLKKQTLFFPAFALILYIVLLIVTTLASSDSLKSLDVNSGASGMFLFLFNFILVIGFMFSLLILPGKFSIAGSDFMTKSGKYMKDKLPRKVGGFGGRMVAGTTGRAGRALIGRGIGGKMLADSKWLKEKAQKGSFTAQMALKAGAGLQNRTYDARNLGVVKNSAIGKEMGKGIKSWDGAVKDKKEAFEKRKKEEMKLFGFDKIHETDASREAIEGARAFRDTKQTSYDSAKSAYEASRTRANLDALKQAERYLEGAEETVGKFKNMGEFKYMEQLEKRLIKTANPKVTSRAGISKMKEETLKKWKSEGQSKRKKEDRAARARTERDLADPPTPPPTPPTP